MLNLVQGPATCYLGAFGATEPADTAVASDPSASDWTDVGATDGGTTLTIGQQYTVMNIDQVVEEVGRRLTARTFQVVTNMAEPTLQNLIYALNGGTIATGSGFRNYTFGSSNSGDIPTYWSLLIDGWAPGTALVQKRRRAIVRKVLATEPVAIGYTKEQKVVYQVTWMGHYVSSVIKPIHIVDGT
jgi:hypothetical protein